MKKRRITAALLCSAALCFGQEEDETVQDEAVRLPGAQVSAEKETTEHISRELMNERGDTDLWQAMRHLPGVTLTGGGTRNESAFKLRGQDATGVPAYIDGIPWIDPSRGQIDYGPFLTGDLESIDIMKGYTSMLLGPNNLSGAIMMRLAKPKKPLELFAKSAFEFDGGGYAANTETLSAGTKMGLFYAKANFQWRGRDHWRLPDSFVPSYDTDGGKEPGAGGNPQSDGNRLWSERKDLKASALAGLTPFEALDIWATYVYVDSDKGFSAPNTVTNKYQVWQWPFLTWHKMSLNAKLDGERINAHFTGYFDKFDNRLNNYPRFQVSGDNAWAAYQRGEHTISDYDDWTAGANLDGSIKIGEIQKVSAAFQWRETTHKVYDFAYQVDPEHKDEYKTNDIDENMFFGGAEYSVNPIKPLTAVAGVGVDILSPKKLWQKKNGVVQDELTNTLVFPQWSAALFYDLAENHELHLSYAKKNRFPTMHERFSTMGSGENKPNPDLKPVEAHNTELGYKGVFLEKISVSMAAYYNFVYNNIAAVTLDASEYPPYKTQQQNVDKTAFYGFEFSSEMYLNEYLALHGRFGAQKYYIDYSEKKLVTLYDNPELTFGASLAVTPFAAIDTGMISNIKFVPSLEYTGSRMAGTYKKGEAQSTYPSYMLAHISASCDITKYTTLSLGVRNLFDELYEMSSGSPQPGRSFSISVEARY
jgi:iron complex outermembrane receptor protein